MTLQTYFIFVLGAFALVATPGPDFIAVLSRSMGQGAKAGFWAALGVSSGLLLHTIFAVIGLSALLYSSSVAFLIVKYVGVCYLVYIGVKTIMNKNQFREQIQSTDYANNMEIYRQGLLTNTLNPKAGLTFMAYMPQFLPTSEVETLLVCQLGLSISIIALVWFSLVGLLSGFFRRHVVENEKTGNVIRYCVGSILMALGLRLAYFER